jgi:sulfur-carrier protein adenylyltransferase/sulfurtransferase
MMYTVAPNLLRRTVKLAVVGCGGTGSAVVAGLPHLHQAMIAGGHPSGLSVTVIDGDRISPANCVRQPFSESEIGLFKAVVLLNRLNLFWGLEWTAVPQHVGGSLGLANDIDLVIGCVDTRQARATIHRMLTTNWCDTRYWLDVGNNADSGQFVLGQPLNRANRRKAERLRTVSELFEEIIEPAFDDDTQPSCSAAEALERQHPFINQALAQHALALLSRLFRCEPLSYHGGFVNLPTGSVVPLRADPVLWRRIRKQGRRREVRS